MKKKSGFKIPLWLRIRYAKDRIWYFFHRMKRHQYAYLSDDNYNNFYREDRFFYQHYVEYDKKTGEITYSQPYNFTFEPYPKRYKKLADNQNVFRDHLTDFEKATGFPGWKYTMDYGKEAYLEYLKEHCPDAVFAKKFEKREPLLKQEEVNKRFNEIWADETRRKNFLKTMGLS